MIHGRSLRKYCKDEAVDYSWLMEFKKTYSASRAQDSSNSFIPLSLEEEPPKHLPQVDGEFGIERVA